MAGAALYYRALYQEAEESRQRVETQAESWQMEIEQLTQRMRSVAALDLQHTRELENDKNVLRSLSAMWLTVVVGCRSVPPAPTCPLVPPPAWMMQPAPDLLTPLNEIISPSDDELK
ncbi:hypothetical protein SODG_000032 [Sodalis praecaptivus]